MTRFELIRLEIDSIKRKAKANVTNSVDIHDYLFRAFRASRGIGNDSKKEDNYVGFLGLVLKDLKEIHETIATTNNKLLEIKEDLGCDPIDEAGR